MAINYKLIYSVYVMSILKKMSLMTGFMAHGHIYIYMPAYYAVKGGVLTPKIICGRFTCFRFHSPCVTHWIGKLSLFSICDQHQHDQDKQNIQKKAASESTVGL